MRVLHVVRQYHPSVGGLENMVRCLTAEQKRLGLEPAILTLDRPVRQSGNGSKWPASDVVDGVPVTRIPFSGSGRYPIAPAFLRHLGNRDIVHVHGLDFFADALAVTQPGHRKPMVLSTHGGFFHTPFARRLKQAYFRTITRTTLTRYARVIASSDADAELFRRIAGRRVVSIENGVDTEKFSGCAAAHVTPSIVALGRIAEHKGLDRLIRAIDIASREEPDIRLTIIGNDFDGTLDRLLIDHRAAISAGRVRILSGLSDFVVRDEIGQSSFIASASEYEGFGISLLEGMSAGLVPLASPIPTFRRILSECPSAGALIDFDDPEKAGRAIAGTVAAARRDAGAMRAAVMRAARGWSWNRVADRFTTEYETVLGRRQRTILGVRVAPLTANEAMQRIDSAIRDRARLNVVFANANALNSVAREPRLRSVLESSLVLPDGIGIDIASRWKYGSPFPENLNGTDFVPRLLAEYRKPLRLYLLGGQPGIAERAASYIATRWPHHRVAGVRDGYFRDEADLADSAEQVRRAGAHVVLVALGNPAQEQWIARFGPATGAHVLLGVGALLDRMAGVVPRAPDWMRAARIEWVYRLAREPRRLAGRYLIGNPEFLVRAWRDRFSHSTP